MSKSTVLITVPKLADEGMRRLAAAGARSIFVTPGGGEAELAAIMASKPIDALILRTLALDANAIRSCAMLKVISRHGSGYNGVDLDAASERRIPVFIAPAGNSQSVAEPAPRLGLTRRWRSTTLSASCAGTPSIHASASTPRF